jgi:hypothetical protein
MHLFLHLSRPRNLHLDHRLPRPTFLPSRRQSFAWRRAQAGRHTTRVLATLADLWASRDRDTEARRLRMAAAAERERERAERAAELAAAAAAFSSPADSETALTEEEQEAAASAAANATAAAAAAAAATADNPADDSQDDALYPPLAPFLRLELCDLPADCVDEALMLRLLASLQAPPGRPASDATPLQVRFAVPAITLVISKPSPYLDNCLVSKITVSFTIKMFIFNRSVFVFPLTAASLYVPPCMYHSLIRRCCWSDPQGRRRPTWPPTPCCWPRAAA